MNAIASAAGALWGGAGIAVAAEVTAVGPDYAGLAALITACSGFIATIGAIYIGSRKKSASDDKVIELLEQMVKKPREAESEE